MASLHNYSELCVKFIRSSRERSVPAAAPAPALQRSPRVLGLCDFATITSNGSNESVQVQASESYGSFRCKVGCADPESHGKEALMVFASRKRKIIQSGVRTKGCVQRSIIFLHMAPYYHPVTSRCYRNNSPKVENSLRTLNIHQFLLFPAFQQNMPLMYELLKCWDASEEGFIIKGYLLKFMTDEVTILTGLPNTGAEIIWQNEPLGGVLSTKIKSEMAELNRSTDEPTMLRTFIMFLVSNLIFPLNNHKTPRRLVCIANSVEEFSSLNWAWTLREFLINEFNKITTKFATEKPLGYINEFSPLLLVSAKHLQV
ncbi:hypothetical protein M5K25_010993 [Dendrobium thyrsiflorum]|uniref:Uncharacterized protein n=1 Tax=Dendrobium thyrsiflorum TaxID=117978 RepID=A0ABD0V8Y2_DENTH